MARAIVSGRNTGATTNDAPASITACAVAASVTVPAPSRNPAGRVRAIAESDRWRRDGHRHLERAHAALGNSVGDRPQLRRILHPDHGDDAERFDLCGNARRGPSSSRASTCHTTIVPMRRPSPPPRRRRQHRAGCRICPAPDRSRPRRPGRSAANRTRAGRADRRQPPDGAGGPSRVGGNGHHPLAPGLGHVYLRCSGVGVRAAQPSRLAASVHRRSDGTKRGGCSRSAPPLSLPSARRRTDRLDGRRGRQPVRAHGRPAPVPESRHHVPSHRRRGIGQPDHHHAGRNRVGALLRSAAPDGGTGVQSRSDGRGGARTAASIRRFARTMAKPPARR